MPGLDLDCCIDIGPEVGRTGACCELNDISIPGFGIGSIRGPVVLSLNDGNILDGTTMRSEGDSCGALNMGEDADDPRGFSPELSRIWKNFSNLGMKLGCFALLPVRSDDSAENDACCMESIAEVVDNLGCSLIRGILLGGIGNIFLGGPGLLTTIFGFIPGSTTIGVEEMGSSTIATSSCDIILVSKGFGINISGIGGSLGAILIVVGVVTGEILEDT